MAESSIDIETMSVPAATDPEQQSADLSSTQDQNATMTAVTEDPQNALHPAPTYIPHIPKMSGEVLNSIWSYLDCKVASTCLGLTCKRFYEIHRSLYGSVGLLTKSKLASKRKFWSLVDAFPSEVKEQIFNLLPPADAFAYALANRSNYTEYCCNERRFNILTSTKVWGWDHQWHWRQQEMPSRRQNWEEGCPFKLLDEWKGPNLILHSFDYPKFVSMERFRLDGGDEKRPPVTRWPACYAPVA